MAGEPDQVDRTPRPPIMRSSTCNRLAAPPSPISRDSSVAASSSCTGTVTFSAHRPCAWTGVTTTTDATTSTGGPRTQPERRAHATTHLPSPTENCSSANTARRPAAARVRAALLVRRSDPVRSCDQHLPLRHCAEQSADPASTNVLNTANSGARSEQQQRVTNTSPTATARHGAIGDGVPTTSALRLFTPGPP